MPIHLRDLAMAGALASGILGATLSAPVTAHAAAVAVPAASLPSPADTYRQGMRKGLLDGDDLAEKACDYYLDLDIDSDGPDRKPPRTPDDPANVAVPPGHGEDWNRGYREGFRRGWTEGLRYYCEHGS
jgi:hypothetical protein